ncbi:hypothetical protein OAA19_02215 [Rubripirellula sp.]|nr:hypothetical protein [Rubripirellula sp.]MDB4338904.1 hypothetical protein [Rubripirellula sp.]
MSGAVEAADLGYPEKPDAHGYAKKYYKRRAFYFGTHNSAESFVLFGEWKRRLVESGVPTEVKELRKEMAHADLPQLHLPAQDVSAPRPMAYAKIASVAAAVFFAWVACDRYFFSSAPGPTVDGITLSNEEIDFIRGIRRQSQDFDRLQQNHGEQTANVLLNLQGIETYDVEQPPSIQEP